MKREIWVADWFQFRVTGQAPQRFLGHAAGQGVRLRSLRRQQGAFTAVAAGADHAKLVRLAKEGGWTFTVLRRYGPGHRLEKLLARPGVAVGVALFLALVRLGGGFVWSIDLTALDPAMQPRMRTLLAQNGIFEGVRLEETVLDSARQAALAQSDQFGWVSLNFTGGCLAVETTQATYQTVQEDAPQAPLYAKTDGEVVAVEPQSGFAVVTPGQPVEQGQLLVDTVRLDRDGDPVRQGVRGRIVARIEKSYTAHQPYESTQKYLTGQSVVQQQLFLLGHSVSAGEQPALPEEGTSSVEWLPLRFGRLCLPACLRRETVWLQKEQPVHYTPQQAQALARRSCRALLYADFPDAVIEQERCVQSSEPEGECCTITYIFCANIAVAEPSQPGE